MSTLLVTYQDEQIPLDEFFKSMMFQRIMDGGFSRDERDVMLVIFRKTIHFNKWDDYLGIHWLTKDVGISLTKLRQTIKQLEAKGLIEVEKSKGGSGNKKERFNKFSLSLELLTLVINDWLNIKDENGFIINGR